MSDQRDEQRGITRRQFVQRGAATTAGLLLVACGGRAADSAAEETRQTAAQSQAADTAAPPTSAGEGSAESTLVPSPGPTLTPTPSCDDHDETPPQMEGPFYTPDTPERTSFLEDGPGITVVLTGRVLTTSCEPIVGAVVDFWHADDAGQYDNAGYRFRGHQFTDADGNYRLETVVPGLYPGRTRHFHVKVQGPNTALLTTQLYFPGEPGNESDGLFNQELLVAMQDSADGKAAAFNFVL